jgi:hypothetical protein
MNVADPHLVKMLSRDKKLCRKSRFIERRGTITEIKMKIQRIEIQLWDLKFQTNRRYETLCMAKEKSQSKDQSDLESDVEIHPLRRVVLRSKEDNMHHQPLEHNTPMSDDGFSGLSGHGELLPLLR